MNYTCEECEQSLTNLNSTRDAIGRVICLKCKIDIYERFLSGTAEQNMRLEEKLKQTEKAFKLACSEGYDMRHYCPQDVDEKYGNKNCVGICGIAPPKGQFAECWKTHYMEKAK